MCHPWLHFLHTRLNDCVVRLGMQRVKSDRVATGCNSISHYILTEYFFTDNNCICKFTIQKFTFELSRLKVINLVPLFYESYVKG